MGYPAIPFKIDATVTTGTASGVEYPNGFPWNYGDKFSDERGRVFVFLKIDPALTNNASASGECGSLKAAHTWTNDVSDASNSTYPTFAGVALGVLPESTSTTTVRAGLFLVHGRCTVTATDGNVVLASAFELGLNTSVDGGCLPIDETSTALADGAARVMYVGQALADDVGNACDVMVNSLVF